MTDEELEALTLKLGVKSMNEPAPEVHVEPYGKKFKWFVISEYNNHVVAQGVTARVETAHRHGQQALFSYLETVNS